MTNHKPGVLLNFQTEIFNNGKKFHFVNLIAL